ncbi:MAG TPA: SDR family NAD(P)-dependent oxidoreductase [Campylobacterales bacterium]|nr:SDR family NAD(P)-dependent oxidoreductase [Campylobacterales bacterium]HIP58961.1 SDR family NAD(P)-dependent oxidoreductase [Campylobacterales bacterium]
MKDSKKVVLITGASSGMGKATALYLAQHDFKVYAGSRTPEKKEQILTIGEIAKEVGYKHQGHFSKLFFQNFGVYPKDLLKR